MDAKPLWPAGPVPQLVCPVHGSVMGYMAVQDDVLRCAERDQIISPNVGLAAEYAGPISFHRFVTCGLPLEALPPPLIETLFQEEGDQ